MQKMLVVGCGYLGRKLASHFAESGWEVTAWTSSAESAEREASSFFRVSPVNICDLEWVRRIGDRDGPYDWVVDCVSSRGGNADRYREIYRAGATNLIRGLVFGRLVFTSSTSVYGQIDGKKVDEDSATEPVAETGKVLLETEELILARGGIVARLAGIYGAGRMALLQKFREGISTLDGDGSRWLNTIHCEDAIKAIALLIDQNAASGIYNLADDGGVSQLDAFRYLVERLQLPLPPSAPPNPNRKRGFSNKMVLNSKLRRLGWQPRFSTFLQGLEQHLESEAPSASSVG